MRSAWVDWVFMGAVVLAVVVFLSYAQQRVAVGQVVGGNISLSSQDCVSYSSPQSVSLSTSLLLCPNTTHSVEYFSLVESGLVINCQGSILQGSGGALFVSEAENPTITLVDCVTRGFDGLYSTINPVVVRVETRN
jgi:hypothetical protein